MDQDALRRLALIGARQRLAEIHEWPEVLAILVEWPDLANLAVAASPEHQIDPMDIPGVRQARASKTRRVAKPNGSQTAKPIRRKRTPAQREALSRAMRKVWRARKANAAALLH